MATLPERSTERTETERGPSPGGGPGTTPEVPAPSPLPPNVFGIYVAELVITSPETRSGERTPTETTSYSFEPLPDFDVWEGEINKVQSGGEAPSYLVKGLGAEPIRHGEKLFLKTATKRVIDARNALTMARIKCPDLWFYARPKVEPEAPPVEAAPVKIEAAPIDPGWAQVVADQPCLASPGPKRRKAVETVQLGFDFGGSDG